MRRTSYSFSSAVIERRGLWMRRADLERLVAQRSEERRRWASREEIAKLAGCSHPTVDRAITSGAIELRPAPRTTATRSLERVSAERWAAEWRRKRRALERNARRRRSRVPSDPPDDGHVWLDTATAALVAGVSENWLRTLAASSKAPATRCGRKLWWRRDLIESFAAARVRRGTCGDGIPGN